MSKAESRAGLLQRAACVAQVLVADIEHPVLGDADVQHVGKVLRARSGEGIALVDGRGRWRIAEWQEGSVRATSDTVIEPAPAPLITVCMAVLKSDRNEWAVQKLTECGVDRIVMLTGTDHGVVRWDDKKAARNVERLQRIALEASMQSRRVWLPEVGTAARLDNVDASVVAVAQTGGDELALGSPTVAIGPEGGWSSAELDSSARFVDLGSTILRAETAAVAVGVRLCALREFQ